MKSLNDFIQNLQQKPYETRVKILWATVVVVGILLIGLWVLNLKSTISSTDQQSSSVAAATKSQSPATQTNYLAVERAEVKDQTVKLFFNLNNTTSDILNVPNISNITLETSDKQFQPSKITDRQGQPFVQKVLSHTQAFGILVFENVNVGKADLIFDQMFFEPSPDQTFSDKLSIDITQLSKNNAKLRD